MKTEMYKVDKSIKEHTNAIHEALKLLKDYRNQESHDSELIPIDCYPWVQDMLEIEANFHINVEISAKHLNNEMGIKEESIRTLVGMGILEPIMNPLQILIWEIHHNFGGCIMEFTKADTYELVKEAFEWGDWDVNGHPNSNTEVVFEDYQLLKRLDILHCQHGHGQSEFNALILKHDV